LLKSFFKYSFKKFSLIRFLKTLTIFCILLGSSQKIKAQKIHIPEPEVDTSYIKLHYGEWSLRAFGALRYHNLTLKNDQNGKVRYTPDNPLSIGFGFAYRFIVLDLGLRLNNDKELTKLDFQSQLLIKNNLIEVVFQSYQGFQKKINGSSRGFRKDLKSTIFTLNHFYNINPRKLTLSSALAGNKVQRKSAGTLLLGSYLSYNKVTADSILFSGGDFNDFGKISNYKMLNLGAYFGYAYTLVLPKKMFLFGFVSPGIGLNFAKIDALETYTPPVFPAGKLHFRVAVGRYSNRTYVILGLTTNLSLINLGHGNRYRQNAGNIKLVFGYRFNSKNKITETIDKTF
jgi:Domain of unknown function (DUF4421)